MPHHVKAMLEFDGEVGLSSGKEQGDTVVNINPGIKFEPIDDLELGLSVGVPLTSHEEFDVRVLTTMIYEFE